MISNSQFDADIFPDLVNNNPVKISESIYQLQSFSHADSDYLRERLAEGYIFLSPSRGEHDYFPQPDFSSGRKSCN